MARRACPNTPPHPTMKTRPEKIKAIATALNAYSDISQPPDVVYSTLDGLEDVELATLHGITGVFCHAASTRMPRKWLAQIHEDLLDAFCHFTEQAHQRRIRKTRGN